jgi:hypothetical protein
MKALPGPAPSRPAAGGRVSGNLGGGSLPDAGGIIAGLAFPAFFLFMAVVYAAVMGQLVLAACLVLLPVVLVVGGMAVVELRATLRHLDRGPWPMAGGRVDAVREPAPARPVVVTATVTDLPEPQDFLPGVPRALPAGPSSPQVFRPASVLTPGDRATA